MSSILIIVIIVALLVCLVSFAVISQTIANAREKRSRLVTALKSRARQLKFMLSGFPEGFLPRDISLLLQKNLLDVFEQLTHLDPKNSKHKEDLLWISSLLADTQRQSKPHVSAMLENLQQIKEAKNCLEELHRFVYKQERKAVFNRANAENYRSQIKLMMLELTMDSYTLHGRSAEQVGKYKLAVLHFEHALNLALKDGSQAGQIIKKVNFLKQKLEAARKLAEAEDANSAPAQPTDAEEQDQAWQQFESETDDSWKKKHAYD